MHRLEWRSFENLDSRLALVSIQAQDQSSFQYKLPSGCRHSFRAIAYQE